MPGTRNWCAMWGLNDDHHLREKVLAAIKNSPDSAIWIDGRCIYEGNICYWLHLRFFDCVVKHADTYRL